VWRAWAVVRIGKQDKRGRGEGEEEKERREED